jgi:hypothetical protein
LMLADLANMHAADGRFDLARETIRLAHAAAADAYSNEPGDRQWLTRVAARQAALDDIAGAEAGAAAITDPSDRASYLIEVIGSLPKSTDAETVERLVKAARSAADAAGEPMRPGQSSRDLLHSGLARALAEAGWIDLALTQDNAHRPGEPPRASGAAWIIRARLKRGTAAEAEGLMARFALSDGRLWVEIADDLVEKRQYSAALDFIARHPDAADMFVLARAKVGAGDIAGAIDIASKASTDASPADNSFPDDSDKWTQVWRDITIALAADGSIEKAMVILTWAVPDWATSTNAAVARALVRAGRRDEAKQFARAAFNGFVAAGEFGDHDMPGVANAFLTAGDVRSGE